MKKFVLLDEEYTILKMLLNAVPPAQLPRVLPECNGVHLHFYRRLLTKVLRKDFTFPKTDE